MKNEKDMSADELCDFLWKEIECGVAEEIHRRLSIFESRPELNIFGERVRDQADIRNERGEA